MKTSITKKKQLQHKIIAFLFWIMVWWVLARLVNQEIYVPTPMRTLQVLIDNMGQAFFWKTIMATISRVAIGFFFACIIGVGLGVLCGMHDFSYTLWHPVISAIKSTPVMSFILIAIIWFQSNDVPVFICFLMGLPIIWTSAVEGIHNVDNRLIQMASVYKVDKKYRISHIYFPSITPYIRAAMITALGLGWKVTVAAEVLSNPKFSIGTKLSEAKVYVESASLFAWTIVVIILSLFLEGIFKKILRKILPVRIQK
ncbi:ABC transporter permease subunit [Vallitalea pronyensis]|uniref:ABC transporter permease subunit n=1 Tax=Vallitalea pronyensis TaxID=1348613 RepID=A0A8J8MGW7_9FIRM|nr:ABC transporter permease subunit [Vallitalea pronyensis]QUI21241.1 ABC transporter permease subunit [Vallitalea pronyensis]